MLLQRVLGLELPYPMTNCDGYDNQWDWMSCRHRPIPYCLIWKDKAFQPIIDKASCDQDCVVHASSVRGTFKSQEPTVMLLMEYGERYLKFGLCMCCVCMYMCLCARVCLSVSIGTWVKVSVGQETLSDVLEVELQAAMRCPTWVQGTKVSLPEDEQVLLATKSRNTL